MSNVPLIRKRIALVIRLVAIGCFFLSWYYADSRELQLRMVLGWVGWSYLAQTIHPARTAPWEPDYERIWEKS